MKQTKLEIASPLFRKSIGQILTVKKRFVSSTCKVILGFANVVLCGIYLLALGGLFQPRNTAVVKIPFQEAIYTIIIVHRKEDLVSFLSVGKENCLLNRFIEKPPRN